MEKNVMPVDMNSDTFDALKKDMTVTINKLIRNMIDFKSEKAAMTVKVTVEMDDADGCIIPRIKHKVSCTVQQKDEREGQIYGVYTLEKNEDGTYRLERQQTELFE